MIFESAAQAMLQITIFFQTEEDQWNWIFVAGIITSFVSLANGFSTIYTVLPTEESPVQLDEKLTFCQHFTLVSSMIIFTSTRYINLEIIANFFNRVLFLDPVVICQGNRNHGCPDIH